jgi:hypothetical protein
MCGDLVEHRVVWVRPVGTLGTVSAQVEHGRRQHGVPFGLNLPRMMASRKMELAGCGVAGVHCRSWVKGLGLAPYSEPVMV